MGTREVPAVWGDAIKQWETWMRAAHRPATTRGIRTYHLRRLALDHPGKDPWDLDQPDLLTWLAAPAWAPETRRSHRASIRQFYGWAHARGHVPTNPAYDLPSIRPPRAMPRPAPTDVVRSAISTADDRVRLMIQVLAQTGMRRGELARLHSRDLELSADGWSLRVRGKGDKVRLVPVGSDLARLISTRGQGYLFPSPTGAHLSAAHVGKLVSAELGAGWTAHTLRHRFATAAYAIDRDLRAVQELLGHAKPETTAIYTQLPDGARRRAAAAAAVGVA